ncbi:Rho GTPase-activating protein 17 [Armadillidium nasatum]|uniref:Rho GTPase-activating protein 17 n=1 Tax=Armadillidium nasatum TaxID=96803 RepID=A0A5N5SIJ9_9CRUS|nr:Rho GTPase-activating protein 17 [Armadillidium nasatum]
MNFGSKFNRVKLQADRLFLRGDKTDVVGDLRDAEEYAEELRLLCEAFSRSLEKKLNTHQVTEEKKHRKVPENQVAEILKEALKEVSQNHEEVTEKPLLKTTIEEIVAVEQLIGKEVLDYEDQVMDEILVPIHKLLKDDFPSISKQKKALKQAGQDVDAAKARVRNSQSSSIAQPNKVENYKEELEEAENKLEQMKDSYACDLFTVLGKQREITRLSNLYLEMKVDHLQRSLQKLNTVLPPIRKIFEESTCSPMYGVPLHEHLRITQQEIAVPIQVTVKRMVEFGLFEEGLLRMAGSSTKIKRMKGLFDAGLISFDSNLEDYNRDYDVHVVAGSFKSYLRELPEPLLTNTRHDELIEAVRKADHKEKLKSVWQVINTLPAQNYNNLRYVIKFLAKLASHSNENKMTPNNIAIVMAPNLIGSQKGEGDNEILSLGRNMSLGFDYRVLVEQLIEYSEYFFKGDIEFGVIPRRPEPPPSPKNTSSGFSLNTNGTQFVRSGSHRRTGSSDFSTVIGGGNQQQSSSVNLENESPKQPHRIKKKPAPLPPQGKVIPWADENVSHSSQSHSPESVRSKTPPSFNVQTSSSFMATSNPMPSPAPRLHHTNSLKRPTSEPPKPPGNGSAPVKPPRPNPPLHSTSIDNSNEAKDCARPPRPSPPNIKDKSETSLPPIGFESIEDRKLKDDDTSDIDAFHPGGPTVSAFGNPICKEEKAGGKQMPVIGFHVENISVKEKIRENELIQEQGAREPSSKVNINSASDIVEFRRGNNSDSGIPDSEFRKSLEGVLKNQPQSHSRHLVKPSSGSDITPAPGENVGEIKAPIQLPVFPIPAQRTTKELPIEKPEPAPRSDKPAVPEKPSAINRTSERASINLDRPFGSKISALTSSYTQGMSRSNEKLVDAGKSSSTDSLNSSGKSDLSALSHDTLEKPSKPPKPCTFNVIRANPVADSCEPEKESVIEKPQASGCEDPANKEANNLLLDIRKKSTSSDSTDL